MFQKSVAHNFYIFLNGMTYLFLLELVPYRILCSTLKYFCSKMRRCQVIAFLMIFLPKSLLYLNFNSPVIFHLFLLKICKKSKLGSFYLTRVQCCVFLIQGVQNFYLNINIFNFVLRHFFKWNTLYLVVCIDRVFIYL